MLFMCINAVEKLDCTCDRPTCAACYALPSAHADRMSVDASNPVCTTRFMSAGRGLFDALFDDLLGSRGMDKVFLTWT